MQVGSLRIVDCTAPKTAVTKVFNDLLMAEDRGQMSALCLLDLLICHLHAAASAFRQPSPTCRTAFPAQHLRPSGVLGCGPDGLELTAGFYPGSNEQHIVCATDYLGVLKRTCSRVTSASAQ